MKKTLFLVLSSCIFVFGLVAICTAPIINGVLKEPFKEDITHFIFPWKSHNCKVFSDNYKKVKDDNSYTEAQIESAKKTKNKCYREEAMYGLEYSSLILDIVLGFVCAVLGLLHYFDVGKPFEKITGIIGLSAGVITFILTLVYICYSGYIFTKHTPDEKYDSAYSSAHLIKLNKDGAFAKQEDGTKYKCLYYKSNNEDSIYAKFSDLGNRQYNYEKKRKFPETDSKYNGCTISMTNGYVLGCATQEYFTYSSSRCEYLYLNEIAIGFGNKYLFDMWVTTIIFTVLICVCAIGLAIFGFLLFKNSDGSGL